MTDGFEEEQRLLDPHRLDEGEGATEYRLRIDAAADRLRHHGHR